MTIGQLTDHCEAVEECYEFMLAYAAQGHIRESHSGSGDQLRQHLDRALDALSQLVPNYRALIESGDLGPAAQHRAFSFVLERDCDSAVAAIRLVRALSFISSQVIDNLNASLHLRALLTDLFLIDEVAKPVIAAAPLHPERS